MSNMKSIFGSSPPAKAAALGVALAIMAFGQQALADQVDRAQGRRMYERLTGTPPSEALLNTLETMVDTQGLEATAQFIIDPAQPHSKNFYSVTLKNFASP